MFVKTAIAGFLALSFGIATASATTYDAFSDFSTAGNPNGPWGYGYGTPGTSYTSLPNATASFFAGDDPGWYLSGPFNAPLAVANRTGAVLTSTTVSVPIDTLFLHPGDDDAQAAIVRFTAPEAGSYAYNVTFARVDTQNGGGTGVGVTVYDADTVLFARSLIPTTYGASVTASGSIELLANEVLSFVVDRNGGYFFDSTSFSAQITVAEPASLGLLATGLLGIRIARRRRR